MRCSFHRAWRARPGSADAWQARYSGDVHRLRRKRDAGTRSADDLGDVEEKPLLDLEKVTPVARMQVGEDFHVQRKRAETQQPHSHRVRIDQRMFADQAANTVDHDVELIRGRLVAERHSRMKPDLVTR